MLIRTFCSPIDELEFLIVGEAGEQIRGAIFLEDGHSTWHHPEEEDMVGFRPVHGLCMLEAELTRHDLGVFLFPKVASENLL